MNYLNQFVNDYRVSFGYKEIENFRLSKKMYIKETSKGMIVIEHQVDSKYVNFFLNSENKTFKKGDLAIALIESTPVAWKEENER